jgi:Protein of unknown function (DUF3759).
MAFGWGKLTHLGMIFMQVRARRETKYCTCTCALDFLALELPTILEDYVLTVLGDSEDAHRRVYGGEEHHSKWTHELAAGAASFAAMKAYEDHQRKEGMLRLY